MNQITLQSFTQRIVVDANSAISIVNAGPQGPPGVSGGSAASYFHTQVAPASSWVINHNLGFRPNVTVEEETTGDDIMCSVIHHSVTQIELQFNIPRAGSAYLS